MVSMLSCFINTIKKSVYIIWNKYQHILTFNKVYMITISIILVMKKHVDISLGSLVLIRKCWCMIWSEVTGEIKVIPSFLSTLIEFVKDLMLSSCTNQYILLMLLLSYSLVIINELIFRKQLQIHFIFTWSRCYKIILQLINLMLKF